MRFVVAVYAICSHALCTSQDGQRTLRLSHQLSLYHLARRRLCYMLVDDAIAHMVSRGTTRFMGGATGLRRMAREKRRDGIVADSTRAGAYHRCFCGVDGIRRLKHILLQ